MSNFDFHPKHQMAPADAPSPAATKKEKPVVKSNPAFRRGDG